MDRHPLISCLCLTRKRPDCLKRAIDCYSSQTYANKELLVVYHDDDLETRDFLETILRDDIISVELPSVPKIPLGEIRNISISSSNGEYFCQWDDDDWYHENRLEVQMNSLLVNGKEASVMYNWLIYDYNCGRAFLSFKAAWAGSLLCKRTLVSKDIKYPPMNKHEDLHFLIKLFKLKCLYPLVKPTLYIKTFHGNNVFEYNFFKDITDKSQPLSNEVSEIIKQILNENIRPKEASAMLNSRTVQQDLNFFHFPVFSKQKLLKSMVSRFIESARNGFARQYY